MCTAQYWYRDNLGTPVRTGRCPMALSLLSNCIGVDADAEQRHYVSVSMSMQMSSGPFVPHQLWIKMLRRLVKNESPSVGRSAKPVDADL
ncbi:hypothetical protein BHE74_00048948 [Ensete ventricosum]|nr:hypothetical protein BHE74_00048948 [Ensete ventricosum]